MRPRQRQNSINEDEASPKRGLRGDPFSMVGKPLSTSLDAGVPLRDVQEAASHADPRTTMRQSAPVAVSTGTPPTSSLLMSLGPPGKN